MASPVFGLGRPELEAPLAAGSVPVPLLLSLSLNVELAARILAMIKLILGDDVSEELAFKDWGS